MSLWIATFAIFFVDSQYETKTNAIFKKSNYVWMIRANCINIICRIVKNCFHLCIVKSCCFEISIKMYFAVQFTKICTLILASVYIFKSLNLYNFNWNEIKMDKDIWKRDKIYHNLVYQISSALKISCIYQKQLRIFH